MTPRTPAEWTVFFEAIPDDQWVANGLFHGPNGSACARGHIHDRLGISSCAFMELMQPLTWSNQLPFERDVAAAVNDGRHPRYQQPTPKTRILAALRDLSMPP